MENKTPKSNFRTDALSYATLADLSDGRKGVHDVACPLCGPERLVERNQIRRVMRIWIEPSFASFHCARCGESGWARDDGVQKIDPAKLKRFHNEAAERDRNHAARQLDKGQWLWSIRQPIPDTPAERYLRWRRHYEGSFCATMGFLSSRGEYPPALISAFAIPTEPTPGTLFVNYEDVQGVHLVRLTDDGRKADTEPVKIMLGPSMGTPIVLGPMNDQLGLVICEGIETGLSLLDATECGVWAAGSASRMPALADVIPPHVDCVTIAAEPDPAGLKGAGELAQRLDARGIYTELRILGIEEALAA